MTCKACDGEGRVNSCDALEDAGHRHSPGGIYYGKYWLTCEECGGTGEIESEEEDGGIS